MKSIPGVTHKPWEGNGIQTQQTFPTPMPSLEDVRQHWRHSALYFGRSGLPKHLLETGTAQFRSVVPSLSKPPDSDRVAHKPVNVSKKIRET